jgi:hypothetical protein
MYLPDMQIDQDSAIKVNPELVGKTMVKRQKVHRPFIDTWEVQGEVDGVPVSESGYVDNRGSKCWSIDYLYDR